MNQRVVGSTRGTGVEPFFRYYGAPQSYLRLLLSCLSGQRKQVTPVSTDLEVRLSRFLGAEDALCLPQARLGIYVALKRYLTADRPNVILSPYTIYDVVNMVIAAGGTPVFADIDPITCNIDFESVAGLIDERTGAVLVTHLHGLACEMSPFVSLCREKHIPLIEDCAQAFGGMLDGRRLGTIGDVGIFSFSMKKHVNGLYGGCLVVRDDSARDACREFLAALPNERRRRLLLRAMLSLCGDLASSQPLFRTVTFPLLRWRIVRGDETTMGAVAYERSPIRRDEIPNHYLRRMTSLQASVVSKQLVDVDRQTRTRIEYAREYHSLLGHLPGLDLPPLREDGSHVYLSFAIQTDDRLEFQRAAMAHDCDVRLQSYCNLAAAPCYADFVAECPVAEQVASRVVLLPIHTGLGMAEIRRVGSAIASLVR